MEAYSKPLVSNNSYADIMANTAKGAAALGDVLENHGPLEALDKQMKALSDSEEAVKRYADAFGGAFGDIGASIAKVGDALVDYGARRRAIHDDLVKGDKTTKEAAQASAKNQVDAYADITGAAKGMFSEHSRIYKGLQAAETTFRAVQLALSIQKMIQDTAETVGSVANSAARATAAGAEGVASQSKLPFPANIAAMAATAAALVGIGVALSGGIGGSHNTLPAANTGTGTVLGDSAAKSESIVHGLDLLKDIDDATLNVSRDMLNSLRAIENSIGGVASLITRTGNLDASAGVDVGVQSTTVSGVVKATVPVVGALLGGIIDKLFGSKTSIIGSGLYGGSQSIGDILGGGFDLQTYSDIEKKKKLFGVTTSTKYSTAYGQADDGISDQFGLLIRQFYETIGKAAGPLGQSLDDVQGKLSGFVVNIGKIDLAGLSGTEIEEKLSAIFGAAADDMAAAAVPGLDRFQKVGEGAFETLVRVSSTVEQIDATFRRLGATSTTMGVDVDMAIAGLFDSVGDFTSAADAYFDKYYSDAEKAAAMTAQLGGVFDHLGLAMPDTLASFRALVEAQDLTTTAGQQTYATLLQIAPAFADLKGALEGTASAAEILRQREDLEKQLLEAQGDTAAIRALELSKIDESNRAIQERIWAIQDEKEAEAKAAQQAQEVAAKLQAIASERLSLEGQLLQLQGNVPELRRRELEALDPTNRAIKQLIYDLTDQKAATDAAAQAAAVDAAAQKAIADERAGLERQLLDLAGDTVAIRALELAKLDPTNRELQKLIWARQDEATALAETTRQQEELAAKLKAIADERIGLEDQLLQLQGNTAELRRRELEKLGPTNRAIQQLIYDLTDQKEATDAAAKAAADAAAAQKVIADERAGLERQLLELNADTVAIRALDLAKLDESNRALQLLIWTRQDEAEVAAAAAKVIADAAAKEQAVADERAGLERQLLDLSGDTNAIRALDLLKLDESNRALQTLIWTRQDETAAAQAAAAAQKAIADERAGLQQQLYQALGDTDALRAIELEKLDASNRAIQLQIWALADQAAATEKAAQAAQEAAAKEQAVAQERAGLQQQIWQLLGDTASLRAAELARLDPSNRAMQERIYAITDQQAADEAAAKAAQVAQQAADDAAKAADQLRQAWAAIGDGLMDEVRRIRGLSATGPQSYAALLGQFNDATSYARAGDQDAAKSLTGLSKQLLDAAALVATSQQELGRVQGMTAASLEDTLAVISAGAFSAKDNLTTAQNWASASVANAPASGGTADLVAEVRSLREEVAALRADQRDANATIAANTGRTARILDNVTSESGGDAVTTQAAAA